MAYRRQNNRGASNNNDLDEKETQSKDRAEDMETEQGEREVVSRLTAGLLQYDPDEVEEEFKRMEEQTVILTEEEFHRAVYENNYKVVFDCLRSDNMPDADFTTMFLDMARRNKREVALLLAAKVPDLTVLDLWGQNALTLAAKHGNISFAYSLLRLGVPLNLRNRENQTAFDVAALYGNMPFCKFCQNFSTAQNVPLT